MSILERVDAIVRALHDALPIVGGDLERCNLCHALAPVELLRSLPCADFVLLAIATEDGGVTVCSCHAPPDLLAADDAPFAVPYRGAWAACPACRADVDAGTLRRIADRAIASQVGVLGAIMPTETMRQAHRNLLRLILDHRLPGGWMAYVPSLR